MEENEDERLKIVYQGRLDRNRAVLDLIEIKARLDSYGIENTLSLAGYGDAVKKLQRLVRLSERVSRFWANSNQEMSPGFSQDITSGCSQCPYRDLVHRKPAQIGGVCGGGTPCGRNRP